MSRDSVPMTAGVVSFRATLRRAAPAPASGGVPSPAPVAAPLDQAAMLAGLSAAELKDLQRRAYERAGVREYWLVHPVDRLLTLYRRGDASFDPPVIQELAERTGVTALPGVSIAWEPILRALGS